MSRALTNTELALLSLVVEREMHGYEVERLVRERGMRNWTQVGFSSDFFVLRKLERAGLVASRLERAPGRGPARRVYAPTDGGRVAYAANLQRALSEPERPYPLFLQGLAGLSSLPPAEAAALVEPDVVGAWSVKDVLAHLGEWEQMALGWYRAGLRGDVPELPAPGYKWNETPRLKRAIFERRRDRPLDEVVAWFRSAREEMRGVIESLTDDQIFTHGRFAWTRKTTLGTYFVSATAATTCGRGRASRAGSGVRWIPPDPPGSTC